MNFINAQDCRFEKNEIDDFTKTKIVKTKLQTISTTRSQLIKLSLVKNKKLYFKMLYHSGGMSSIVVSTNNPITLMLKNDDILELIPTEIYSSEITALNGTEIVCNYYITKQELQKIRSLGLKKIRFNTSKSYYDFVVEKENLQSKFNSQVDCFLNEIQLAE